MIYRYEIYIGLKDKDILNNEISTKKLMNDFKKEMPRLKIDFSLNMQKGGYINENGEYVAENSAKMVCVGNYNDEDLSKFIDAVKRFYNQETILLTKQKISANFRS